MSSRNSLVSTDTAAGVWSRLEFIRVPESVFAAR